MWEFVKAGGSGSVARTDFHLFDQLSLGEPRDLHVYILHFAFLGKTRRRNVETIRNEDRHF